MPLGLLVTFFAPTVDFFLLCAGGGVGAGGAGRVGVEELGLLKCTGTRSLFLLLGPL